MGERIGIVQPGTLNAGPRACQRPYAPTWPNDFRAVICVAWHLLYFEKENCAARVDSRAPDRMEDCG